MATFDEAEVSTADGRPIELYEFFVEGAFFRFTNGERAIPASVVGSVGDDFVPAPIKRDPVEQSSKQISGRFKMKWGLRFPASTPFLALWVTGAPETDTTVTIYKQHVDSTGFQLFWDGEIRDVAFRPDEAEMLLSNVGAFFSDKGPRLTWGGHCGHNFGDALCKFPVGTVTRTLTVASVAADGITVTINDLSTGQTDGDYIRGELLTDVFKRRYITQHVGDVVTLLYPLPGLETGSQVEMVEGCPHNKEACNDRFANIENFGGAPYTPNINPFERSLDKV